MLFPDALEWLQSLPEGGLLAGTGLILAGQGFAGFILPGEPALLLASAAVSSVPGFLILWAVATACSVVGNMAAYEVGRRVGPSLRNARFIRKHGADRWDKAMHLLQRHGTRAVFVGRLIPFVRDVVSPVAGAAGVTRRMFLTAATAGSACATLLPMVFAIVVAHGLRSSDSVTNIAVVGMLVALAATIVVLKRRARAKSRRTEPDVSPHGAGQGLNPRLEPAD
jgi:membrane-associated protein